MVLDLLQTADRVASLHCTPRLLSRVSLLFALVPLSADLVDIGIAFEPSLCPLGLVLVLIRLSLRATMPGIIKCLVYMHDIQSLCL